MTVCVLIRNKSPYNIKHFTIFTTRSLRTDYIAAGVLFWTKKRIMKAVWQDTIIAESNDTILVERNHYFPPSSIRKEFFNASGTTTNCPWKGTANYYSVEVDGATNADAAWFYSSPKEKAQHIKNYIAFWKGVKIIE